MKNVGDQVRAMEERTRPSNGAQPRRPIGMLRVARVTYDHHPIDTGPGGQTLGTLIDMHIKDTILSGAMVSEVSLYFETREQQEELADIYRRAK